jgi:hypothetical protein
LFQSLKSADFRGRDLSQPQAYPLFLWAFRIALVLYDYYALFTDYWSAFSGQQLVGTLIGAFIWIAIVLYVRRLVAVGLLRGK